MAARGAATPIERKASATGPPGPISTGGEDPGLIEQLGQRELAPPRPATVKPGDHEQLLMKE
jgi:hypothetical protein